MIRKTRRRRVAHDLTSTHKLACILSAERSKLIRYLGASNLTGAHNMLDVPRHSNRTGISLAELILILHYGKRTNHDMASWHKYSE